MADQRRAYVEKRFFISNSEDVVDAVHMAFLPSSDERGLNCENGGAERHRRSRLKPRGSPHLLVCIPQRGETRTCACFTRVRANRIVCASPQRRHQQNHLLCHIQPPREPVDLAATQLQLSKRPKHRNDAPIHPLTPLRTPLHPTNTLTP